MAEWHSAKAPSFRSASIRGWVLPRADSALMKLNLNPERFPRLRLDLVSSFSVMTPTSQSKKGNPMTTTNTLESRETTTLIASDKVEGTAVYGTDEKKLGGYRTSLTKNQLEKAPKYNQSTSWNWNRDNDLRVYDYYKTQPYWSAV